MTATPDLAGDPERERPAGSDQEPGKPARAGVGVSPEAAAPPAAGPQRSATPAPSAGRGRRGAFSGFVPFATPGFRYLFAGTTLTMAGFFMQTVAQGWLIYDLTGSSTWLGIVSFASGIPMLLLALPAGVLVDRFDRRSVLIVAQTFTALMTFILAALVWLQIVEPWHVAALALASGCFFVAIVPARQALLPATVERSALSPAIAMMSAGTNFGRVIGPSVAGVAIAALGAALAFVVQGVGYVLALGCALLLPKRAASNRPRPRSAFQSLLEGLRYVRQDPMVFSLLLLQAVPSFLIMPYTQLMPIFARDILDAGPQGLGTLMTAMGIGSVFGSVVVVMMPLRRQGLMLLFSLTGLCVSLIALAASTSFPLSLAIMGIVGLTQASYLATNNSLVQMSVPDALQGRVMSVYMTTWGLMPLGALPQGILADWVGAPAVVAGAGVLGCLTIVVMAARNPGLRAL